MRLVKKEMFNLSKERIEKLEKLPNWQDQIDPWEFNYTLLCTWLSEHKGTYPNIHSEDPDEKKLAKWLCKQVHDYREVKGLKETTEMVQEAFNSFFVNTQ